MPDLARRRAPWVTTVTADAVNHFAWGIGDDNPLWRDERAAIAPPLFAYAIDETTVAPGHDDLRRRYAAVEWTWFDRIRLGTELIATAELVDETTVAGTLVQTGRTTFSSNGRSIATAVVRCERLPGPAPTGADHPEIRYTPDQLEEIEAATLSETRRGGTRRTVDGTRVGDDVPSITKGPLSIMDVVAWCAGTQGVAEPNDAYSEGGLFAETATGPQLVSWFGHLIDNWMGDHGFLQRLAVTVDRLPCLGSTTTISGRVASVNPEAQVELEATALGKDGQLMGSAKATVDL